MDVPGSASEKEKLADVVDSVVVLVTAATGAVSLFPSVVVLVVVVVAVSVAPFLST